MLEVRDKNRLWKAQIYSVERKKHDNVNKRHTHHVFHLEGFLYPVPTCTLSIIFTVPYSPTHNSCWTTKKLNKWWTLHWNHINLLTILSTQVMNFPTFVPCFHQCYISPVFQSSVATLLPGSSKRSLKRCPHHAFAFPNSTVCSLKGLSPLFPVVTKAF